MRKIIIASMTIAIVATAVFAEGKRDEPSGIYGPGMMGQGMMGPGMMGGYYTEQRGERMDFEEAESYIEEYVESYESLDLEVAEIMEFSQNFYVQIKERGADTLLQELIVDPYSGAIYPEHGPNMMWNLSTPHMMSGFYSGAGGEMSLSEEEAVEKADEYLERAIPGARSDDHADKFNGYYTLHVLKDDTIIGMLSVNGFTGQVWYHNWHGQFIAMAEGH